MPLPLVGMRHAAKAPTCAWTSPRQSWFPIVRYQGTCRAGDVYTSSNLVGAKKAKKARKMSAIYAVVDRVRGKRGAGPRGGAPRTVHEPGYASVAGARGQDDPDAAEYATVDDMPEGEAETATISAAGGPQFRSSVRRPNGPSPDKVESKAKGTGKPSPSSPSKDTATPANKAHIPRDDSFC